MFDSDACVPLAAVAPTAAYASVSPAATVALSDHVESSFATQNNLSVAQIDNGSGPVELNEETAGKAIEGAAFASTGGGDLTLDLSSIYGSTEAGAYPLVLATYEIVCSAGYDADTSAAVKSFLTSAANEGQAGLAEQGYVPLPDSFKAKLTESIDAIA